MSLSPMAVVESLRVGTVDFVSPDEIKVLLDLEAPDSVALNTGSPRPFPRVNSYVLIPSDQGYLVGQVEWVTVERSQFPKRKGMQDFGLIDLPYPLRKMSLNPLGTLLRAGKGEGEDQYRFHRGVDSFPAVGDAVLLPTQHQLRSVVESGDRRRVKIGVSPLAANAEVKVDPDRLFGRHLAVLGNTGSGKSCSVAGLVRWSLEEARKARGGSDANARFIVLDPNGEYADTFSGLNKVRVFAVDPTEEERPLQIPMWLWNSEEWSAFTQASGKVQRPILRRALREVRAGTRGSLPEEEVLKLRRHLSSLLVQVRAAIRTGEEKTEATKFGFKLNAYMEDVRPLVDEFPDYQESLASVVEALEGAINSSVDSFNKGGKNIVFFRAFELAQVQTIIEALESLLDDLGGIVYLDGPEESTPLPFRGGELADQLDFIAQQENVSQFVDFLAMRIRTMLGDENMKAIAAEDKEIELHEWLSSYFGGEGPEAGSITVIDMSLVPAEVIHVVTAVIARMALESLQRYRKLNQGATLPTVLVMEEAHTFVKRYSDEGDNQSSASICCKVFEKIAREGRKFGLGLVLSSQRPSELSPTVLSQCNTYLLHRISNDRDQELVNKLVPDNLRGLLRDLPSLPSRHAILLGWASELPVLVQMNFLAEAHRPQSNDPDFWAVWCGEAEREIDWKRIADDWQQRGSGGAAENGGDPEDSDPDDGL